jgi:transposase
MNIWRLTTMNLHELLRRLRAGESRNAIARALGVSPNTVKTYRRWAEAQQLLSGPLPDLSALEALRAQTLGVNRSPRHPNESSIKGYQAEIAELLAHGRKPLTVWRLLKGRYREAFTASPSAVYRLVRVMRASQPPEVTLRIETAPGDVAQVDFGYVGVLRDDRTGEGRAAWVFVMTLGWSRHMYAEIVLDQKLPTWLGCHQHAFEFFGGVPQRVVLDNLKAAILKAYTRDDEPEVQQAYRECAEHYGFLIDPCLPGKPQHKGKVERGGVGYLKQAFVPLLPEGTTVSEANRQLRKWLMTEAGLRDHGTTHQAPLARFQHTERAALLPLPTTAYDSAVWKRCRLHRDGHITFERAYYSAPHRLIGQRLWLRAGLRDIRLFSEDFQLVASHPRARQPGQRFTQPDHLPPHQAQALTCTRLTCQAQADAIGPSTGQVIADLLAARPVDRFRTARRVLRLADAFTSDRLEAACALGLAYGDTALPTLKRILRDGLEAAIPITPPLTTAQPESLVFARSADELAHRILGGATWN